MFSVLCFFNFHRWSNEDQRPCEKFKSCWRCKKEEVKRGWHVFSNWSAPYAVSVYETHGTKNLSVTEERQKRNCTDCNLTEERVLRN